MGSMGSVGVVRRIIIGKRRESLKYTLFAKDEKPFEPSEPAYPLKIRIKGRSFFLLSNLGKH